MGFFNYPGIFFSFFFQFRVGRLWVLSFSDQNFRNFISNVELTFDQ